MILVSRLTAFFFIAMLGLFIACEKDSPKPSTSKDVVISNLSSLVGGEDDLIYLTGKNFSPVPDLNNVEFGNLSVTVLAASEEELLIKLPSYITMCGEVTVLIQVWNPVTQILSEPATFPIPFTINCPSIQSFSPTEGTENDVITLTGSDFTPDNTRIKVWLGTMEVPVLNATRSEINIKIPSYYYAGTVEATIKINDKEGKSTTLFTLMGPEVLSFSSASPQSCELVTITGKGFSPMLTGNTVYFGIYPCTVLEASETQLVVRPAIDKNVAGVALPVYVVVNSKAGKSKDLITVKDAWQAVASLSQLERYDGIGFSIENNMGYAGLGMAIQNGLATLPKDFWQYNPTTNNWIRKTDFPGEGRIGAVGFSVGTKGYVGLGRDYSNNLFNDFWEYDPTLDIWTRLPDFPGDGRFNASGFSLGTTVGFVTHGGSIGGGETGDIWTFNTVTKVWTKVANYPGLAEYSGVGFSIDNKVYMGLGFIANDFWEYTPATNTWKALQNFPETYLTGSVGFSFNGAGIVATGAGNNGRTDGVWKYLVETNEWIRLPSFKGSVRNSAVGFSISNGFVIGTGSSTFNYDLKNDFFKYTCN